MTKFRALENKFLGRLGRDLAKPINPYLISMLGLFTIIYSFYLYVPKQTTSRTYSLLVDQGVREIMFFGAISLGIWLISTPAWAKTINKMVMPLRLMSIYWLTTAILAGLVNWTAQSVIVYVFLSLFCLITAANYSMNSDRDCYKDVFS
jgi:hypothetical protein